MAADYAADRTEPIALRLRHPLELASQRVNWVTRRREFFYASPEEAKEHLLELSGELLEYTDEPEALEYRRSLNHAKAIASGEAAPSPQETPAPELVTSDGFETIRLTHDRFGQLAASSGTMASATRQPWTDHG